MTIGEQAQAMLSEAAAITEPGPGVTRLPFTREHRAALELITGWMEAAGLDVRLDGAGTLVGRAEGARDGPVLLLGSHQDSVRNGGAYDGIMGVVLPILAMRRLRDAGRRPAGPVEVLAFADEEGVRWPTALIGPRALAGRLDPAVLEMRDRDGVALGEAMRDFGLDPDRLAAVRRDPADVLGYVEAHIEQGPVLQDRDRPVGVVTAICGIERHRAALTGRAAHAGTTPMHLRQDALAGAAELVLEVERRARETEGLMATVGALDLAPNVVNAVPGAVQLTVEIRAPEDPVREAAGAAITEAARATAVRRRLEIDIERTYAQPAQPCDAALSDRLQRAAGDAAPRLASGATHDASAMADLCPMAMLFVRCRDGVSHHPDEHAEAADMGEAAETLARLVESYAPD